MPPIPEHIQLAHDLYAAGLAPKGVTRQDYMDGSVYWRTATQKWEPWRNIGDVWHLVLRYRITIYPLEEEYWGITARSLMADDCIHREEVNEMRDIPVAIARLALRLRAETQEHPYA